MLCLAMKNTTLTKTTPTWFTYLVRCNDNSLYAGITTDIQRRVSEHNSATKGAKYTRHKQPVALVYYETTSSRSLAAKREYQLKQLTKQQKEALIASFGQKSANWSA